jgi:serine/threonine protein kinase
VAVKILEKEKIKDKKDVERITREIKILKKVRHPNVIQLYEVSQLYSTIYPVLCLLILMLLIFYSHFYIMVKFYSW